MSNSVDKLFREIEEWHEKHPVRSWVSSKIARIQRFFTDTPYQIKHFIQRGKKGWSSGDWWRFDYYISDIIVECLKQMKEKGHGLPTAIPNKDEKEALKEWHTILEGIIYTFTIAKEIADGDVLLIEDSKDRKKQVKYTKHLNKKYPGIPMRVLTVKEIKKYKKGWKLLEKWFFNLWD
jgi:hypothetical protein